MVGENQRSAKERGGGAGEADQGRTEHMRTYALSMIVWREHVHYFFHENDHPS